MPSQTSDVGSHKAAPAGKRGASLEYAASVSEPAGGGGAALGSGGKSGDSGLPEQSSEQSLHSAQLHFCVQGAVMDAQKRSQAPRTRTPSMGAGMITVRRF